MLIGHGAGVRIEGLVGTVAIPVLLPDLVARFRVETEDKGILIGKIIQLLAVPLTPHNGHIELALEREGRGTIAKLLADGTVLLDEIKFPNDIAVQIRSNQITGSEGKIDPLPIGHRRRRGQRVAPGLFHTVRKFLLPNHRTRVPIDTERRKRFHFIAVGHAVDTVPQDDG